MSKGTSPATPVTQSADTDDVTVVEFVANASIRVRLLDGGEPVTGVRARLMHPAVPMQLISPDSEGRIVWEDVAEGTYWVHAAAPGYWSSETPVQATRSGRDVTDVQLRKTGDLRVLVRSASASAAGLAVELEHLDLGGSLTGWIQEGRLRLPRGAYRNGNGELEVRGIPNGNYRCTVSIADGREVTENVSVTGGRNAAVTEVEVRTP